MAKLSVITDEEWQALTSRLVLYAVGKMRRLRWRGCPPAGRATGPGGFDASDLAATAVERVLDGSRAWDETTDPYSHLCSVVDSVVSHLADGQANRHERAMPTARTTDGGEQPVELPGHEPCPARAAEDMEETNRYRAAVRAAVAKDELARDIFDCLEAGFSTPAEMAVLMGKSVEQIYTAKRRLQRAVESVLPNTSAPPVRNGGGHRARHS